MVSIPISSLTTKQCTLLSLNSVVLTDKVPVLQPPTNHFALRLCFSTTLNTGQHKQNKSWSEGQPKNSPVFPALHLHHNAVIYILMRHVSVCTNVLQAHYCSCWSSFSLASRHSPWKPPKLRHAHPIMSYYLSNVENLSSHWTWQQVTPPPALFPAFHSHVSGDNRGFLVLFQVQECFSHLVFFGTRQEENMWIKYLSAIEGFLIYWSVH